MSDEDTYNRALIIVSATQAERPASSVRCNPCGAGSSGDWFKRTILEMAIGGRNDDRGPPGNVLLDVGEANLPKQSVVNISQVFTVDKSQLGEKIGLLSTRRVRQILDGVQLLLDPIELNDWES